VIHPGTVVLNAQAPDSELQQQQIIFDPIPRVDGTEPSDDPLLELRAAIYLVSGRRRRQLKNRKPGLRRRFDYQENLKDARRPVVRQPSNRIKNRSFAITCGPITERAQPLSG
jgi:catalase